MGRGGVGERHPGLQSSSQVISRLEFANIAKYDNCKTCDWTKILFLSHIHREVTFLLGRQ